MLDLDDPRLNAGYRLPDPIHPSSLVMAIEEVGARFPSATDDALLGYVAIELGVARHEVVDAERPWVTGLNDLHTPGAPLRFMGRSLEYWSLLDDLSAQGWTWGAVARAITDLHRANSIEFPPF